ncbi:DNA damage-inducible transcript 4-like protein [Parasteatoda tepidariorum]|uniref:DNA damage-inducible transcript 4-like protein n=1 Tax=Parasteatoda tepidariorum TaxID=114398 RepID=UPI00077FC029|nr:DNA damage-inducible transcript 4-like protein [Parasteatoda tepidariorum]
MSLNKSSLKSSSVPLSRVFDKFGDIICDEWNKSQNMKVPNSNPPLVWSRPFFAQDSDTLEALKNNMNSVLYFTDEDEPSERLLACQTLMERLEQALREAKLLHLHCGEVLLPHDLIWRIVDQVVTASENEPCGLRGCLIYIHLQDAKKLERRRVGVVKCDPNTVATFEIHLTLFQDNNSWWSLRHLIPDKLLQSMGKRSSLVVSSHFLLDKKKLYRSSSQ